MDGEYQKGPDQRTVKEPEDSFVPTPMQVAQSLRRFAEPPLRAAYHVAREVVLYPRAQRILRAYEAHYQEARRVYASKGHTMKQALTQVLVRAFSADKPDALLTLPDRYGPCVERIRRYAQAQLERSACCWLFPKPPTGPFPEAVRDIPAVREGAVIAVQLKDWLSVEGLDELCDIVLPQLEANVYGTHLIVDKVYVYRNLVSRAKEQVSWTWHYDNHPPGITKLMVYLTDVTEQTGPFEYLRSARTKEALYRTPTPLSGYGRISPSRLQRYLAEGYESCRVTGPCGTLLFFDENVVHKANVAKSGVRDAVVLQIRPATFRPERYIDSRWTGSFQHRDFNADPYDTVPRLKEGMLSG